MIALRESAKPTLLLIVFTAVGAAQPTLAQDRIARIHERYVFADMHAHPSRFHRANVPRITAEEIARYRRGTMDIVVSTISTDAIYSGNYVKRDGSQVPRGHTAHSTRSTLGGPIEIPSEKTSSWTAGS